MVRLLIVVIGLFLIWVLFFSSFTKRRKIIITAVAVLMSAVGVWLESNTGMPRGGVIAKTDVASCGVKAAHSYRSNFDLTLCLRNNASDGQVKHVGLLITAQNCTAPGNCVTLETVQREVRVDIAPNSEITVKQNLTFDDVDPAVSDHVWSAQVESVKAVR